MMELPDYHWPTPRNVAIGLWQRVVIFLRRVGGIILVLTIADLVARELSGAAGGRHGTGHRLQPGRHDRPASSR